MRVALLANQGTMGGGEVMLLNVAEALRSCGHVPEVVAPTHDPELLAVAHRKAFQVRAVRTRGRASHLPALRLWAQSHDSDLLWTHGFLPALATSGMPRRIVHLHRVPSSRLAPLRRFAFTASDDVVVPSAWVAERVPGARAFPNWTEDFGTVEPVARPSAALRVGYLGRTTVEKGFLTLLDALEPVASEMPIRLHVGGLTRFADSAEQRRVQERIRTASFPVRQYGWVAPRSFFPQIDMLVVPSHWGEAFGLVAAEAMSARIPVIVSDDGALPEVVGDDYPYIARRRDVAHLSSLVLEAARSSTVRDLTRRNRQRWEERFSARAGERRVADLLAGLETE